MPNMSGESPAGSPDLISSRVCQNNDVPSVVALPMTIAPLRPLVTTKTAALPTITPLTVPSPPSFRRPQPGVAKVWLPEILFPFCTRINAASPHSTWRFCSVFERRSIDHVPLKLASAAQTEYEMAVKPTMQRVLKVDLISSPQAPSLEAPRSQEPSGHSQAAPASLAGAVQQSPPALLSTTDAH